MTETTTKAVTPSPSPIFDREFRALLYPLIEAIARHLDNGGTLGGKTLAELRAENP